MSSLVLAFGCKFFLDIGLDRQPVTVVTGHIRRLKTHHRTRFDDEILKYLVERRPDMNIGIGIRRPVVQDKFIMPFSGLQDRGRRAPSRSISSNERARSARDCPFEQNPSSAG